MKKKDGLYRLISLVKYFDANYVSTEDCEKLSVFDCNNPDDVSQAIRTFVIEGFLRNLPKVRVELVNLLRDSLKNEKENFIEIFSVIEMAFDDEVENKRNFMQVLLKELEPYAVPEK